jgi:hypothetical protein
MKIYRLIILSFVCGASLMMSSCSDWLDYTPKDKQTAEQQFSTREGFFNAVNGIYNLVSGSSLYGYNMSYGPLDIMGQCYNVSDANTTAYAFQQYTWNNSVVSSTFSSIWSNAYNTILNINMVLKELDNQKSVLADKDYKLIKGEMLALRAFLHFDLLRLYGPVFSKNPKDASIPFNDGIEAQRRERMPADSLISSKLIPDLTTAQQLLAEVDPVVTEGPLNTDGGDEGNLLRYRQLRMNYYATCLLKARVYLWGEDYDNALAEAKKITDDANVAKWFPFVDASKLLANNTNPDRLFSTECLFGFYIKNMSSIYTSNFSGTLDATNILQPRKGYVDKLFSSSADYRRQTSWTGSMSTTGSEYDFIKYKGFTANTTTPEFWATFFGLMRISEAYYIAAECCLQKENLTDAINYLNIVEKNRGLENISEKATSKVILKEIKMEYLRETRGEGQIFFMLKRFYQGFGSYNRGEPDLNGAITVNYDYPSVARYVIPIPSSENY